GQGHGSRTGNPCALITTGNPKKRKYNGSQREPSQEDIVIRSKKIAEDIKPPLLHSDAKMTKFIT
ncbi:Hypothetical protein FKW44_022281, partial [Caligus rogercresseyi]